MADRIVRVSGRTRNYDKEGRWEAQPAQVKMRVERNTARREMVARVGKAALAGKEVDHVKALSRGGSTAKSNLQIISRHANRSKGAR